MLQSPVYTNKPRTSPLWRHFKRLSPIFAKCYICKKTLSFKSSITNLKRHLLLKHGEVFEEDSDQYNNNRKKTSVICLIALVKMHPCLWDTRCETYGNVHLQDVAWNAIAYRMHPNEDQIEIVTKLSEEFNKLRNGFFSNRRSGYHEELSFLTPLLKGDDDKSKLHKAISDIEIKDEILEESALNKTGVAPTMGKDYTHSCFKKKNGNDEILLSTERPSKRKLQETPGEEVTYQTPLPNSSTDPIECTLQLNNADEDTMFLLSLVDDIRTIPRELHMNFKAEMLSEVSQLVQGYEKQN